MDLQELKETCQPFARILIVCKDPAVSREVLQIHQGGMVVLPRGVSNVDATRMPGVDFFTCDDFSKLPKFNKKKFEVGIFDDSTSKSKISQMKKDYGLKMVLNTSDSSPHPKIETPAPKTPPKQKKPGSSRVLRKLQVKPPREDRPAEDGT